MQPQENEAEEAQDVIAANLVRLASFVDVDRLAHRAYVPGPNAAAGTVDREVEARIAERFAAGSDCERAVVVHFRAEDDDRIPGRQRKDDVHARSVAIRNAAGGDRKSTRLNS